MSRRLNMQKFAREMMGRQVRFSKYLKRVHNYPEERQDEHGRLRAPTSTWEARELKELGFSECIGWVVGVRYLQTGVRIEGSGGGYIFDDDGGDPPTFRETGPRKLAVMVAELPTSRPLPVPMEAIELVPEYVAPGFVDERTRKLWSEDSASWPRDARGRFVRG
jgi:hypothetical protein